MAVHYHALINEQGRIIIPAKLRKELHLEKGGAVVLYNDDNTLRIIPKLNLLREAQTLIKKHVPQETSLVEELLNERRQEFLNEAKKMEKF